jgi:hypothetical protein
VPTKVVTATKLEFVELPANAVRPCLVPELPRNAEGVLRYEDLPEYLSVVLGIVQECNDQLAEIRKIQPTNPPPPAPVP